MKYLIPALLAAFSITASAGTTIHCKGLNASGDPLKGLNVSKGHNPRGPCVDDGAERGKPTKDQVVQPVEATTVKSSKSNSSDREQAPVEATTVKGSKSNSDNRLHSTSTVTQGLEVSRAKAPDATPGPTSSKEGSNAEPEKPFKF